jgi:predicted O-linked N-acetylglucosamine transferase (SPINDLY family)
MRILKKVKGSVLWLMDGDEYSRENLKKEAIKRDVESKRIIFSTRLDYYEHNVRYKFCDLFLDTFPYNAHSTASSCLFSGVPLLTIKGEAFQSRVASSLLKDLEMDELICLNFEEYENRAITIANSHKESQRIKNKLHNSLTNSKTFNTKNYTENLEKAYNKIYERYHQKLKPENIFIK